MWNKSTGLNTFWMHCVYNYLVCGQLEMFWAQLDILQCVYENPNWYADRNGRMNCKLSLHMKKVTDSPATGCMKPPLSNVRPQCTMTVSLSRVLQSEMILMCAPVHLCVSFHLHGRETFCEYRSIVSTNDVAQRIWIATLPWCYVTFAGGLSVWLLSIVIFHTIAK
jgi:hypothetical protein